MVENGGFLKKAGHNVFESIKEYCKNSSLAGIPYIVNDRYHFTERIFWLMCITLSSYGSYYLIQDYRKSFESNAISMVVESLRPQEKTLFPSIGVCELGFARKEYKELIEIVESLRESESIEYNNDVEDYLLRVVFQNIYSFGSLSPYCKPYYNCDNNHCLKCPKGNYSMYAAKVRAVCQDFFVTCKWNGKPFDCCQYFLPLQTTMGNCFLLNSIQIITNDSIHWMNLEVGWDAGNGELEIVVKNSAAIHFLNEEDIPHVTLRTLQYTLPNEGLDATVQLNIQNIVNDPGVRDVDPLYRKCLFPDENEKNLTYKFYSFSACATECLKSAQLKSCKCVNYNLITNANDKTPSCNLEGFLCLDETDLMYPQTTTMQPWRTNGLVCNCLPSCNEHEMLIVQKSFNVIENEENRKITISLQSLPTERFRRQAVRGKLDVVVSVGGILGLFMGASILSGIELIYFFTSRIFKFFFCSKL